MFKKALLSTFILASGIASAADVELQPGLTVKINNVVVQCKQKNVNINTIDDETLYGMASSLGVGSCEIERSGYSYSLRILSPTPLSSRACYTIEENGKSSFTKSEAIEMLRRYEKAGACDKNPDKTN